MSNKSFLRFSLMDEKPDSFFRRKLRPGTGVFHLPLSVTRNILVSPRYASNSACFTPSP